MLTHIRHLLGSARYNRQVLLRPQSALALASAWYRNELAYIRRTNRLSGVLGSDRAEINVLLRESQAAMGYCASELQRYSLVLPGLLNPNYGPLLYASVRVLRPKVVVETGVGSGVSSTFFLSALEKNGTGRLFSVDLPLPDETLLPREKQTGWLAPDKLKPRWELTLGDAKMLLPRLLERLGQVDFFYHDSDHSYEHMTWEYSQAYPHIRPGGLLLSDDVTSNHAWDDFVSALPGHSTRINRTGIHRKAAES